MVFDSRLVALDLLTNLDHHSLQPFPFLPTHLLQCRKHEKMRRNNRTCWVPRESEDQFLDLLSTTALFERYTGKRSRLPGLHADSPKMHSPAQTALDRRL